MVLSHVAEQGFSTYSDGDVFGSGKEPVDQDAHERRVQAIFDGQLSQLRIRHTLGHNDSTDSHT